MSRCQLTSAIEIRRLCGGLLVLAFASGAPLNAGTPVLSKFQVQGGPRGLALLLEADAPFGMKTETDDKNSANGPVLKLKLSKALYGLNDYIYTAFPPGCPIKKIVVNENVKSSSIDMWIKLSVPAAQTIRTKQKNNQWMVLVTSEACPEFAWGAVSGSRQSKDEKAAVEQASTPASPLASAPAAKQSAAAPSTRNAAASAQTSAGEPGVRAAPAQAPAQNQQTAPKAVSKAEAVPPPPPEPSPMPAILKNCQVIQRGPMQRLRLICDQPATVSSVARDKKTISFLIDNAATGMQRNSFIFDTVFGFKSLKLEKSGTGKAKQIKASLILRSDIPALVESHNGQIVVSLLWVCPNRIALWSSIRKTTDAYSFVETEPLNGSSSLIGEKAKADANREIKSGETFSPRGSPPPAEAAPVAPANAQAPITQPPLPKVTWLVVVKDNVNLRSEPSASGSIVEKLPLGTMGTELKKEGSWLKLHTPQAEGWISASLVLDSAKVPTAVWEKISKRIAPAEAPETKTPGSAAQPDAGSAPIDSGRQSHGSEAELADSAAVSSHGTEYREYGRDPFMPLKRDAEEGDELGKVEDMALVGVLIDDFERLALLEDKNIPGRAYALRESDAVKHGRVLRIMNDNVVFLVNEYGVSKTYTIKLRKEKLRSAVSDSVTTMPSSPGYLGAPPQYPYSQPQTRPMQAPSQNFRPMSEQQSTTPSSNRSEDVQYGKEF